MYTRSHRIFLLSGTILTLTLVAGCGADTRSAATADAGQRELACEPDDDQLSLPEGFCAIVVADELGAARHLAVAENGDIFVALRGSRGSDEGGGVVALRDTTGDGVADVQARFGDAGGTGLHLAGESLYFGPDWGVLRYRIPQGELRPSGPADTIVSGLPSERSHAAKALDLSEDGTVYVNIGSPSNTCQQEDRTAGSPGMEPCPELETRAGVWTFDADRTGQTQADGTRFATGIRNAVALTLHPETGTLYVAQHGRDQLIQNWPDLFTEQESAEKPAEELMRVDRGDDFGWPYCYYDPELDRRVLAPEYGGDGEITNGCEEKEEPLVAFPGHWAPNDILFYTGDQFPAEYRGGAFIAFHGSWNRAPLPQAGYKVVFVPFQSAEPAGEYRDFADGFARGNRDPREAPHRPTGLAQGPDGSLYISDDAGGRIWRIVYRGG